MRIVFVGASNLAVMSARNLLGAGHEVVIIDKDKALIDELSNELDCGFLHGDGSKPAVLKEAGPKDTDFLFCLAGDDKDNIISSLIGRSLGFTHVITKIENLELEHICTELGLKNVIVPTRTISRYLADIVSGRDILEFSGMIKGEARFFSFIAGKDDQMQVSELQLPDTARVVCYYREGEFYIAGEETKLREDDEVVILTHSENMSELSERWKSHGKNLSEAEEGYENENRAGESDD